VRAIVTGAAGFLGGAVAARLAADPRVTAVTGLDRLAPPDGALPTIAADIARFDAAAPDAELVVHAAAITTQASEDDPDLAYAINVEGMRAVLRWASRQAAPPRIVFLSSLAVFGNGDASADEATPPNPQSTYGTTKLIAERLLADATRRGAADGVVLRLPVIVVRTNGRPARPGAGFVSALIDGALRGLPCNTPFAPGFRIPVASSGAVVGLVLRAALDTPPARLLHVPALPVSAEDVAAALARCRVPAPPIAHDPDPAMERLVAGWPERMRTLHPRFSDGLADTALDPIIEAHRTFVLADRHR